MGFWDKAKKAAEIAGKVGGAVMESADKAATKHTSKMSDSELESRSDNTYAQAEIKKRGN
jgi:hypothetical protein